MRTLLRSFSLFALATCAVAAQAALTVYTDRTQFLAALGATSTETFDHDAYFALGDNDYHGVNFRQTGTLSPSFVSSGRYVATQRDGLSGTEIVFGSAVRGFGADFDGANSLGGLAFTIGGETASLSAALPFPGTGFFGVVSSAGFTTVSFKNANGLVDGFESYTLDDLTYVAASPSAVPGPMAALPFALMALKRRRTVRK